MFSYSFTGSLIFVDESMAINLIAGSFESEIQLPEKVGKEDTDKRKRKESSEDEEGEEVEKANSGKRKGKQKRRIVSDEEEEQAGPSSPVKKKSKKICFCKSPLTDASLCTPFILLSSRHIRVIFYTIHLLVWTWKEKQFLSRVSSLILQLLP